MVCFAPTDSADSAEFFFSPSPSPPSQALRVSLSSPLISTISTPRMACEHLLIGSVQDLYLNGLLISIEDVRKGLARAAIERDEEELANNFIADHGKKISALKIMN